MGETTRSVTVGVAVVLTLVLVASRGGGGKWDGSDGGSGDDGLSLAIGER